MRSILLVSFVALGLMQMPSSQSNTAISYTAINHAAAADVLLSGEGSIESRPQNTDIREGNKIVGRRTLSLTYTVTWELKDSGEWKDDPVYMTCYNDCLGKKHKKHEECDTSCDEKCKERHRLVMRGEYQPLRDNMRQAERDSATAAAASGANGNTNFSSATSQALRQARQIARRSSINKTLDHWIDKPCYWIEKKWDWKRYDFIVKGKFTRHISETRSGKTQSWTEDGAQHSMTVAYVWKPDENGVVSDESQYCLCYDEEEAMMDYLSDFFDSILPVFTTPEGEKTTVTPENTAVHVQGIDMNNVQMNLVTGTVDLSYSLPAGYELKPENDSCQTMVTVEPFSATNLTWASINGNFFDSEPTKVRVLCTEMKKKAPTPKDKFKITRCRDRGLRELAKKANQSRFRGPWDQARLWIYTDQATIDDISKRMTPGVSKGQYVNGAFDVANIAMVDMTDKKYRKCLKPDLLLGQTASAEATDWLVDSLTQIDANKLAGSIKSVASKYREILGPKADEFDINHAAEIAYSLGTSDNEKVRISGLEFLLKAVPDAHRNAIAEAGGLDFLGESVVSESEKEALKAIEVIQAYGGERQLANLNAAAQWGTSDKVKKKAESVLQKMS